jgi:hypothetical protein
VHPDQRALQDAIRADGFVFVEGGPMRSLLGRTGSLEDWPALAASWNDLALDPYMADGGRYRRRRHATFAGGRAGAIERQPHQPHYQSLEYNPLHGGIERWFEPMTADAGSGPSMTSILTLARDLFSQLSGATVRWHIEAHQFRIEAGPATEGRPTPEGLHRDGVDFVLVLLVNRCNIASGTTTIHALDGRLLGDFTLARPFDAALVEDARVSHGVTPVRPVDPAVPAYRDVLVVTFVAAPVPRPV